MKLIEYLISVVLAILRSDTFMLAIQFAKETYFSNGISITVATVQLTSNIVGTRTTRYTSTWETRKGTGSLWGIVSKTKITQEFNYS